MKIAIVGGGIIGISTALFLKQNSNHDVTIVTEKTTPNTTADGAAGIWGPYLLDETPVPDQRRWAKETHDLIEKYWTSAEGGLMGISLVSSTRLNMEQIPPMWHDIVYGFRKMDQSEVKAIGRVNGEHNASGKRRVMGRLGVRVSMFKFKIQASEVQKSKKKGNKRLIRPQDTLFAGGGKPPKASVIFFHLFPFFLREFKQRGGKVILGVKVSDLTKVGQNYDLVINCTGVWAGEVAKDAKVAPVRGQVMRVRAPWIYRVILDDRDDGNYIITNQDSVVLGGTHQYGDWNTRPCEKDSQFITSGCQTMFPSLLAGAEKIKDWVGLRPGRSSVRLEREALTASNGRKVEVIHNYGHGGSGITIFWGCAKDTFKLVQEVEMEQGHDRMRFITSRL
ncbi:D-aspartate oxidase-like [Tigriopus californicus]|uniref:D-aspartate oxidase-like n=1 Tax=Tigriopus californicus TaxID=6832 RepID=UPI0027DA2D18|nr:D-aspartate oxidase-like [Tigriopus californicus]